MTARARQPRTAVLVQAGVPVWTLRVLLGVLTALAGVLLTTGAAAAALSLGVAALVTWRPHPALVGAAAGLVLVLQLVGGDGSIGLRVHALVLLLPLLVRLGGLVDQVAWNGVVEARVLGVAARRLAVVQLAAQPVAVLAAAASGAPPLPWVGVAAVLAVGVLALGLLRQPGAPR